MIQISLGDSTLVTCIGNLSKRAGSITVFSLHMLFGNACSRSFQVHTLKKFVLQTRLCIFFFRAFFQEKVETGNPGEWCNDNFPWVFEGFWFMTHAPCSRFFLKNKKHTPKQFVLQEFLHDAYSKEIRAPGFSFMGHTLKKFVLQDFPS